MATLAVILTQPPYGNLSASEGIEFALASTNYGHECSVFFVGKGVLQLMSNQQPSEQKNHAKQLKVMPLYDIGHCYACAVSLLKHNVSVDSAPVDIQPLTPEELSSTLANFDHTVTF